MFRFLRIAAGIAIVAGLVSLPFLLSGTEAASTNVSVIVELRDDPGAVYAAKLRNQGGAVSNEQVQAYEQGVKTAQDRFLTQLTASGVLAQVQSVTVSDVNFQIRYSHIYNGIALSVPSSSLATIKAMPQVKAVHPNTRLYTNLDKSVPYIGADDRTYGSNNNRFTANSSLDGNEGQATFVAIIDTGIDLTHPDLNVFQHVSFTPLQIYLGKVRGPAAWEALGIQCLWVLLLFGGGRLFWRFSTRKLSVQGG